MMKMIEYALPGEQLQTSPEFKQGGLEKARNMQQTKKTTNKDFGCYEEINPEM